MDTKCLLCSALQHLLPYVASPPGASHSHAFTSLHSPHGLPTTPNQCHREGREGQDLEGYFHHDPAKYFFLVVIGVWGDPFAQPQRSPHEHLLSTPLERSVRPPLADEDTIYRGTVGFTNVRPSSPDRTHTHRLVQTTCTPTL